MLFILFYILSPEKKFKTNLRQFRGGVKKSGTFGWCPPQSGLSHTSIEGGSYTCTYGDNRICNACPAVGISQSDYVAHVNRHHVQVEWFLGLRYY